MPAAALKSPTASAVALSGAAPYVRGGAAAGLPQRIKLLGWGENIGRTTRARIVVGAQTVIALSGNQQATANDRVPLDYEHQSVPGHPNFRPDPRDVAGHGVVEIVPNDGVYLSAIDYTPSGQSHALSYQDVSAVAHLDADGNLLWISSVALTQRGDVAGMEFSEALAVLSARESVAAQRVPSQRVSADTAALIVSVTAQHLPSKQQADLAAALTAALSAIEAPKPNTMDTDTQTEATFRSMIIALLGLKPGESGEISDEEIASAVAAKTEALSADKAAPAAAADAAPAATEAAALSARMDRMERERLLDQAKRDGKVIPLSDELVHSTSIAVLSALVKGLPAGEVPLATSGHGGERPAAKVAALSADQAAAAKSLGLTEEEYRKAITA